MELFTDAITAFVNWYVRKVDPTPPSGKQLASSAQQSLGWFNLRALVVVTVTITLERTSWLAKLFSINGVAASTAFVIEMGLYCAFPLAWPVARFRGVAPLN